MWLVYWKLALIVVINLNQANNNDFFVMTLQVSESVFPKNTKKKTFIFYKWSWHSQHLNMVELDAPEFAGKVKCANVQR